MKFMVYENIGRPLANRFYLGGWEGWRFDAKSWRLSEAYLTGEITLKRAHEVVDQIDTSGRFSGRSMREAFDRVNLEAALRNAAPSVPDSWRRQPNS